MNAARGGYWLVLWSCFAQCAHANAAPSEPRLTGIVVLENRRMALLELPVEIGGRSVTIEKPILKEGEHDGAYNLIAIDEKGAKVALRKGTEEAVELKLDQAPGEELANRTINLTSAALEQVVDVYQMLSGRTVIRSTRSPQVRLDLKSGAGLAKADAAVLLEKALVDQEMLVQPEGDKFVLLIPVGQARLLAPIPELPSLDAVPDEIIPAGIIKFQDTDLLQVLDIYGDLTGRTLLRPNSLPPTKISVRSQTSLARKEAIWLLDALLAVSGIAMAPEGRNFVFAVPTSRMHNLPKFKENIAAAKATKVAPPQKMRFDDASVTKLVEAYGHLLGREPAPVDKYMSAVKFSFHTQKELSQAEAIFAVEAVAALNNLRLELVGDDQVQIVPAATPRSGNR